MHIVSSRSPPIDATRALRAKVCISPITVSVVDGDETVVPDRVGGDTMYLQKYFVPSTYGGGIGQGRTPSRGCRSDHMARHQSKRLPVPGGHFHLSTSAMDYYCGRSFHSQLLHLQV